MTDVAPDLAELRRLLDAARYVLVRPQADRGVVVTGRACSRCGRAITDWAERVGACHPDLCFDCHGQEHRDAE